ncbi:MAG: hypothetical protein V4719_27370, partial [Planctomycetota bacterium]
SLTLRVGCLSAEKEPDSESQATGYRTNLMFVNTSAPAGVLAFPEHSIWVDWFVTSFFAIADDLTPRRKVPELNRTERPASWRLRAFARDHSGFLFRSHATRHDFNARELGFFVHAALPTLQSR